MSIGVYSGSCSPRHLWCRLLVFMLVAAPTVLTAAGDDLVSGLDSRPVVAGDLAGRCMVVWQRNEAGESRIVGQMLDREGFSVGNQISVSLPGTDLRNPDAAFLPSGELVIAWESRQAGSSRICARRFDSYLALPLGDELAVSRWSPVVSRPRIGSDALGRLVVAWSSLARQRLLESPQYQIFVRRFDSLTGNQLGHELRIDRTQQLTTPALAVNPNGDFLVVWESPAEKLSARVFDSYGVAIGSVIRVTESLPGRHSAPAVATGPNGEYTVVWELREDSGLHSVNTLRLSPLGEPIGASYQIGTTRSKHSTHPAVAIDERGGALVSWRGNQHGQDRLLMRKLDSYGMPIGSDTEIKPTSTRSTVTSLPGTEGFQVSWRSAAEDPVIQVHTIDTYGRPIGSLGGEDPTSSGGPHDLLDSYGKPLGSLGGEDPTSSGGPHDLLDSYGKPLGSLGGEDPTSPSSPNDLLDSYGMPIGSLGGEDPTPPSSPNDLLDSYGMPIGRLGGEDPTSPSSPNDLLDSYGKPIGRLGGEDPTSPSSPNDLLDSYGRPIGNSTSSIASDDSLDSYGMPIGRTFESNASLLGIDGDQVGPSVTSCGPQGFLVTWRSDDVGGVVQTLDSYGMPIGSDTPIVSTDTPSTVDKLHGAAGSSFLQGSGADPDTAVIGRGGFLVVWELPDGD